MTWNGRAPNCVARGTPVIPSISAHKRRVWHDPARHYERCIEAMFCRLNDFCRIATRDDTLARNDASAFAPATVAVSWH